MKYYHSISELYADTSFERKPLHEEFDVLEFKQIGTDVKKMMLPHRRGFFTIILMKDQKEGHIHINQNKYVKLNNSILFQGTDHIFSFVRDEKVEGFILLFKNSLLLPYIENVELSYPFFSVSNQNLFHLNDFENSSFDKIFRLIVEEESNLSVLKPLLLSLLEKSNQLYKTYNSEEKFLLQKTLLVRKYKNLVNNFFLEDKTVNFYATKLNVTPNYLNEIVKSETGVSAKRHISERVLLEAKNLLKYSNMDIAEIGYLLQFSEPTHFTKFFKKETGITPKEFQNGQL